MFDLFVSEQYEEFRALNILAALSFLESLTYPLNLLMFLIVFLAPFHKKLMSLVVASLFMAR